MPNIKVIYSNESKNLDYLYQLLVDIILSIESHQEESTSEQQGSDNNE